MKYEFNGKSLNIPDNELELLSQKLDISREEAIQCWLEDNDYTESEETIELTAKAKQNIKRYEKSDKKRKSGARERKVDEEKKHLLSCVNVLLEGMNIQTIVKNEAEISFTYGDNNYTFKLIKHRKEKA